MVRILLQGKAWKLTLSIRKFFYIFSFGTKKWLFVELEFRKHDLFDGHYETKVMAECTMGHFESKRCKNILKIWKISELYSIIINIKVLPFRVPKISPEINNIFVLLLLKIAHSARVVGKCCKPNHTTYVVPTYLYLPNFLTTMHATFKS